MSNDGYEQRQSDRDREYERHYQEWVASLSPEERAKLVEQRLDQPHLERRGGGGMDRDLAESPLASENPDIIETVEPQCPEPVPADVLASATSDALASFCARVRSAPNPLLMFDAICYATGVLSLDGASETELARLHGVSRAAFSKRAVKWCETFGIKASRGMKSERARETYSRLTRARWHERNRGKSRR